MSDEKNPAEKLEAVWDDLYAIRKKHAFGSTEYFVLLTFLDQTQMMIEQYKQGRKDGYENGE